MPGRTKESAMIRPRKGENTTAGSKRPCMMRVESQESMKTDREIYRGFLQSLSDDLVKNYHSTESGFRMSICDFEGELSKVPDNLQKLSRRYWRYKVDLDRSRLRIQHDHHYKLPPNSDEEYHSMLLGCYDERLYTFNQNRLDKYFGSRTLTYIEPFSLMIEWLDETFGLRALPRCDDGIECDVRDGTINLRFESSNKPSEDMRLEIEDIVGSYYGYEIAWPERDDDVVLEVSLSIDDIHKRINDFISHG